MTQSKLFSSGIELASFVTSSSILCKSWTSISSNNEDIIWNDGIDVSWKVDEESSSDFTIVAFKATSSNVQADFVSSAELKEGNFLDFEFLCSKRIPIFSLNRTALSLFRDNHQELEKLKIEINSFTNLSTPLIFTGHGLGASIASLFVISLLQNVGSGKNRPLCITFGSPLVGDKRLQQAISCSSIWDSCFILVCHTKTHFQGSSLQIELVITCLLEHLSCLLMQLLFRTQILSWKFSWRWSQSMIKMKNLNQLIMEIL
ncbi:putative carboxylesterase [Medicago truncatula]|uniref:Putative carboxylesterase n=1 Tax=Medicago truncatula TaxID=3880 RepID=A0A396IQP5_MEDTR|nr:putative carboxylesterase [Medicago truncatula]